MGSRQPSVDRTSANNRTGDTPDRTLRAPSATRGSTPAPPSLNNPSQAKNGSVMTGSAMKVSSNTGKALTKIINRMKVYPFFQKWSVMIWE